MRCPRRTYCQLPLLLGWLCGFACVSAVAIAQEKSPLPEVRQSPIRPSLGGLYSYVPGKWSVLGLSVSNPDDKPREVLSATYFDGAPTLQYGRRLWIPARAQIRTWSPVLLPQLSPKAEQSFAFHSVVLDPDRTDEVLSRENAGQLLHSGIVPARVERPVTGQLIGPPSEGENRSDPAYDLLVAARVGARFSRKMSFFDGNERCPDEFSLQTLDQLVIGDNDLLKDPLSLIAIRRWVHRGGLLWLMLDKVDPELPERILGDEFACQVIDRVSLTSIRIEPTKPFRMAPVVDTDYEDPVDLVRVVPGGRGIDVDYTVGGWPAAFWKSFGAGRVLVTTLGARAWMRARQPADDLPVRSGGRRGSPPPPPDHDWEKYSPCVVVPAMADLSASFLLQTNRADTSLVSSLDQHAASYVGYSIPPRSLIVGLLAGFAGVVLIAGIWLWSRHSLEHLGWISPGVALAVTAALLLIGGRNRYAIPATAASVEFVEAMSGTDDLCARGTITYYTRESRPWTIGSTEGGLVWPDMSGQEGTARRLVWSDLDVWSWQNLNQLSPQRNATYEQSRLISERIEAQGTFGPDGLSGRLSVPRGIEFSDALLVTRTGQIGVTRTATGEFQAAADDVLARDQFLSAAIFSDEQDRRQHTSRAILNELRKPDWSDPAMLLLWADRNLSGIDYGPDRRLLGTSLLAVPIQFNRPLAGTIVRIAGPFLPYRSRVSPDGQQSSSLWDRRQQIWQEHAGPAEIWLSFQLPHELIPIGLTGGQLTIQVAGPLGRLDVMGLRRTARNLEARGPIGEAVSLRRWDDPVGTLTVAIVDPAVLKPGPTGDVVFGISIAGPPKADRAPGDEVLEADSKVSYWRIENLSLELTGKVGDTDDSLAAAGH